MPAEPMTPGAVCANRRSRASPSWVRPTNLPSTGSSTSPPTMTAAVPRPRAVELQVVTAATLPTLSAGRSATTHCRGKLPLLSQVKVAWAPSWAKRSAWAHRCSDASGRSSWYAQCSPEIPAGKRHVMASSVASRYSRVWKVPSGQANRAARSLDDTAPETV